MNLNKLIIIGRVGRDPETRDAGKSTVTRTSIGVTDSRKVNGEWIDETEWFNVEAWNERGDRLGRLQKGDLVYIEGKGKTETYEKDGREIRTFKVLVFIIKKLNKSNPTGQQTEEEEGDGLPF